MRLTISRLQPSRLAISWWGDAFLDTRAAVGLWCRQFLQANGQASVHIDERQIARVPGREAQTPDDLGQQLQRKLRTLRDIGQQGGPRDDRAAARKLGHDAGRPGAAIQRHFAEIFAGAEHAKGNFLVVRIGAKHLHASAENDKHGLAGVALVDQDASFAVPPQVAARRQFAHRKIVLIVANEVGQCIGHDTLSVTD